MSKDLTEEAVETAKTPDGLTLVRIQDGDGDGLGNGLFLFIWSDGCKRWKVRKNLDEKRDHCDWFLIGEYPDMSLEQAREASKLPINMSVTLKKPVSNVVAIEAKKQAQVIDGNDFDKLYTKIKERIREKIIEMEESKPVLRPLMLEKPLSPETIAAYENEISYNTAKAEDHYWGQKTSDRHDFKEYEYQKEREYADCAQAYRKAIADSNARKQALLGFLGVLNGVAQKKVF